MAIQDRPETRQMPGGEPDHSDGPPDPSRRLLLKWAVGGGLALGTEEVARRTGLLANAYRWATGQLRNHAPRPSTSPTTTKTPEGPTPTPNPESPLYQWQQELRQAFERGATSVTIGATTFSPGAKVVLEERGPAHVDTGDYMVQLTHGATSVRLATFQSLTIVDLNNRQSPVPVIVSNTMDVIPAMAQAYGGTEQAQQQIQNGRPVVIEHLTARPIHITGLIGLQNGQEVIKPADIMALQLTSANIGAGPATL